DGTQDALIVQVHTDAGITGIGEVDSSPYVAKAIIDAPSSHSVARSLRELLIDQDPFEISALWHRMYKGTVFYGRRGAVIHAMSGIDIALWDLVGKATAQPIYKLIGGAQRSSVRAYASHLMPDTISGVQSLIQADLDQGFSAVKLGWG